MKGVNTPHGSSIFSHILMEIGAFSSYGAYQWTVRRWILLEWFEKNVLMFRYLISTVRTGHCWKLNSSRPQALNWWNSMNTKAFREWELHTQETDLGCIVSSVQPWNKIHGISLISVRPTLSKHTHRCAVVFIFADLVLLSAQVSALWAPCAVSWPGWTCSTRTRCPRGSKVHWGGPSTLPSYPPRCRWWQLLYSFGQLGVTARATPGWLRTEWHERDHDKP